MHHPSTPPAKHHEPPADTVIVTVIVIIVTVTVTVIVTVIAIVIVIGSCIASINHP